MLDLQSPRWKELSHAYGSAGDIPTLLAQLRTAPPKKDYRAEPWFSLWSSLCHQSDIYTASYAAVPHIVAIASEKPIAELVDFVLIAAEIEVQRHTKKAPKIPADLKHSYEAAIQVGIPLVVSCLDHEWPEAEYRVLLGGLAVFRGHIALGKMLLDFDGDCQCPNCEAVFPPLGYDILKD